MSNNNQDKAGSVPVSPPPSSSAANPELAKKEEVSAEELPPIDLINAVVAPSPGELFKEDAKAAGERPASVGSADSNTSGHRQLSAAESTSIVRPSVAQTTGAETGGPQNDHGPSASASPNIPAEPSHMATPPSSADRETTVQPDPPARNVETQAGGARPPRLPPTPPVASCPEEPKPGDGTPPPPFDVEEFIREAEERKRGAKNMREIKAMADYIRQVRERGVPFGSIHRGLEKRGLVSCARTRFEQICAELFPDLVGKKPPSDA